MTADRYQKMSDEDLLRIVHPDTRNEYEDDALASAEAELDHRGIEPTRQEELKSEIAGEIAAEKSKSEKPLSNFGWVIFVLIGPLLLLSIGAAILLYATGNKQKSKDAFTGILAGFIFWGLISVGFAFLA